MDFKTDKPIYRQIVDYCFACILTRKWLPGEKVPSVREMALQMAVNTHTNSSSPRLLTISFPKWICSV